MELNNVKWFVYGFDWNASLNSATYWTTTINWTKWIQPYEVKIIKLLMYYMFRFVNINCMWFNISYSIIIPQRIWDSYINIGYARNCYGWSYIHSCFWIGQQVLSWIINRMKQMKMNYTYINPTVCRYLLIECTHSFASSSEAASNS